MTTLEHCVTELIKSGAVDWVSSAEVAGIAAEDGGAHADEANRELSLRMIAEVVRRGLMELGELDPARRDFRAWQSSPDESLSRVARAWPRSGPKPGSGDVCWLRNTSAGNRQVKSLTSA